MALIYSLALCLLTHNVNLAGCVFLTVAGRCVCTTPSVIGPIERSLKVLDDSGL